MPASSGSPRPAPAAPAALALGLLASCGAPPGWTLTLTEFRIEPAGLSVPLGRPVTLTVVNRGRIEHNLQFEPGLTDAPLPAVLAPGARLAVTFTPAAAGTFRYTCTVPGHAPAGMTGALTVSG